MSPGSGDASEVVVVGGGIIGRACAWRLARGGHRVTLIDPEAGGAGPGTGSSGRAEGAAARVAAGMLSPVGEVVYGEEALLGLNLASASRWPEFAAELASDSGQDPGYVTCGTLVVARDRDDLAQLDELADYQASLGVSVHHVSSRELRRLEPALAPGVRGGLVLPDDHQVDPRRCLTALAEAGHRAGVTVVTDRAMAVDADGVTLARGDRLSADVVVVTAGWATAGLIGLPLRPVKGQVLRLAAATAAVAPNQVVRGLDVYVCPRTSGEVVVGATQEEQGPDTTVTAGATHDLLHDAIELVPGLAEAAVVETGAGLRPGTPDNAPMIGWHRGMVTATGHFRHGVLLAPVTADAVADLITGTSVDEITAFSPGRVVGDGHNGTANAPPAEVAP